MDKKQYLSIISSLENHNYHKLIIGAALKDYEAIENYAYFFTHAKANVIDISAFPHSVICAKKGIEKALSENASLEAPAIMVSVNIGKDPHFRRIEVDYENCTNCLLCVPTCPSGAFSIEEKKLGYEIDLCFACSKCLDYCSFDALAFKDWSAYKPESLLELIELGASAIEIHLNNDLDAFEKFYTSLPKLPDYFLQSFSIGSEMMSAEELISAFERIIKVVEKAYQEGKEIIIQTDGIAISGTKDIKDRDLPSIENAKTILEHLANKGLKPLFISENKSKTKVFVQLAGGIDEKSLSKAHRQNVMVNGVAIGSSARKRIQELKSLSLKSKTGNHTFSLNENKAALELAKNIIKNSKAPLQNSLLEVQ